MSKTITVVTTNNIVKLDKQIKALKSLISKDNSKDKIIHSEALKNLLEHRKKLLNEGCDLNG